MALEAFIAEEELSLLHDFLVICSSFLSSMVKGSAGRSNLLSVLMVDWTKTLEPSRHNGPLDKTVVICQLHSLLNSHQLVVCVITLD